MKFDVKVGFVEIEYGVKIVGDCIIENGDEILGETLMVGITLTGLEPLDAAAAAAALRFLRRPADEAEAAAAEPPPVCITGRAPLTTGLAMIRFTLNIAGYATVFVIGTVADVITGLEMIGSCETAKSEPDRPVTAVVVPVVMGP